MGTRSTVKFKDEKDNVVLAVYQQYDGYLQGVGAQVASTLKKWDVVGVTETRYNEFLKQDITDVKKHNGVQDLALLYVMDNKKTSYNMYVTTADDSQEFNYEVEYSRELGFTVNVYEEKWDVTGNGSDYHALVYTGTAVDFISHIEELLGEVL